MARNTDITTGILYVAATPIGNLEDITLRCLRILAEVDLIAAEDTRHTRKLLTHFEISTPLISYYREKETERSIQLIKRLINGESIAPGSEIPGVPASDTRAMDSPFIKRLISWIDRSVSFSR